MPLKIKFPEYKLIVEEIDADGICPSQNLTTVRLTPEEYNPNLIATCQATIENPTPTKIYETFNDEYEITISQHFAHYLSACLYEVTQSERTDLSDDFKYRGYSPYYNPATLIKDTQDQPVATDLNLKQYLLIDGQPIPHFPAIYISDEGCNPEYLLEKHKDEHLIIIDLNADILSATWHQKLGLNKTDADYHKTGQGLRCMNIPDYDATIYDALRKHSDSTRNFFDSTEGNLSESFAEILEAINRLLNAEKQPQAIIVKCLEGKDRSPSFAFLYTVAWLYKFAKIELSTTQLNELKFLISTQTGPCSPLEFVEKLKNKLFQGDLTALGRALCNKADYFQSTQSQSTSLTEDEYNTYVGSIKEFLEVGLSQDDIRGSLLSDDSRLTNEMIDKLFLMCETAAPVKALPTEPGTGKPADRTTFESVGSTEADSQSQQLSIPRRYKKTSATKSNLRKDQRRKIEDEQGTVDLIIEAHRNQRDKFSFRTHIDPNTATIESTIENALREKQSIFSFFAKDRRTATLKACLSVGVLSEDASGKIIVNPDNEFSKEEVKAAYDKAKEKLEKEQPGNSNLQPRRK